MRTFAYGRRRYFIAPTILAAFVLFTVAVMLLWNALMTVIFNLPAIKFWQAAGLLILARLLFGMGRSYSPWRYNSYKDKLREKVVNMSPEERKEFFKKMHTMRHSWHHEDYNSTESKEKTQPE